MATSGRLTVPTELSSGEVPVVVRVLEEIVSDSKQLSSPSLAVKTVLHVAAVGAGRVGLLASMAAAISSVGLSVSEASIKTAMVRNASIGSCLVAVNAFTVVCGATQEPTFNPRRRREIEMTVASQLYLWLEDQDRRDEAAAESAASKLRDIYRREVDCDIAGIVIRRDARQRHQYAPMTSTESSKENRGVFQGHDNNWDQEEFEGAEEEDGDNDGWGSGGVHYSEYLAAAAAATKAAARSSANVSFSDAMSSHTHTEDVQEESKGNQDDEPTASSIEGSAPFTPPATPAASPAIPVSNGEGIHAESGDVACPSVLLEHRHLSLRLRMQLTRVQTLARTATPSHAFGDTSSSSSTLLARFAHRNATAQQHKEELKPPPPRRLPDALTQEVSQLAALVRSCRHEIPSFGVVPVEVAERALALYERLELCAVEIAAVVVQAQVRSRQAAMQLAEAVFSAICLQKYARGFMLRRHLNDAVTAGLLASGQPIDLAALLDRFDGRPFPTAFYTNKSSSSSRSAKSTGGYNGGGSGHHRGAIQLNAMSVVLAAEADSAEASSSPTSSHYSSPRSPGGSSAHGASSSSSSWSFRHRPTSPGSPSGSTHEKWCPTLHPTYAKPT